MLKYYLELGLVGWGLSTVNQLFTDITLNNVSEPMYSGTPYMPKQFTQQLQKYKVKNKNKQKYIKNLVLYR